jgi:hypothetical protein
MKFISNKNGMEYVLIGTDSDSEYSLLKGGGQYVVAWKLHEVGGGLHVWEQGHYFNDFHSACVCFQRKTAPFDV